MLSTVTCFLTLQSASSLPPPVLRTDNKGRVWLVVAKQRKFVCLTDTKKVVTPPSAPWINDDYGQSAKHAWYVGSSLYASKDDRHWRKVTIPGVDAPLRIIRADSTGVVLGQGGFAFPAVVVAVRDSDLSVKVMHPVGMPGESSRGAVYFGKEGLLESSPTSTTVLVTKADWTRLSQDIPGLRGDSVPHVLGANSRFAVLDHGDGLVIVPTSGQAKLRRLQVGVVRNWAFDATGLWFVSGLAGTSKLEYFDGLRSYSIVLGKSPSGMRLWKSRTGVVCAYNQKGNTLAVEEVMKAASGLLRIRSVRLKGQSVLWNTAYVEGQIWHVNPSGIVTKRALDPR